MKQTLLDTANRLVRPGDAAAKEFSAKRELMTARCNRLIGERKDLDRLIGPENLEMARDNNHNFSRFMESLFYEYQPEILVETVLWVFTAYRSHGFYTTYWPANLNIWAETLKKSLSEPAFKDIYPFYNWLIVNIPIFVSLTDHALSRSRHRDDIQPVRQQPAPHP